MTGSFLNAGHNNADSQQNVQKFFKYRLCCHAVTSNENIHLASLCRILHKATKAT